MLTFKKFIEKTWGNQPFNHTAHKQPIVQKQNWLSSQYSTILNGNFTDNCKSLTLSLNWWKDCAVSSFPFLPFILTRSISLTYWLGFQGRRFFRAVRKHCHSTGDRKCGTIVLKIKQKSPDLTRWKLPGFSITALIFAPFLVWMTG